MTGNRRLRYTGLCVMVAACLVVVACAPDPSFMFIPDGDAYTSESLPAALADLDLSAIESMATDEVLTERQQQLTDLRRAGDGADRLADVLTSQFSAKTMALLIRVERGTYEGTPAWLVFEAWGSDGGPLDRVRVWVFDTESLKLLSSLFAN